MEPSAPLRPDPGHEHAPADGETWVGLLSSSLPVGEAASWVVRPGCGALVLFSGTARDHAPGRAGVHRLEYEAYEEHVEKVLQSVADEAREKWPSVGRIVALHRVGEIAIGESAVVVAVSAPHRPEAFEAARYCIDTVKKTAPIWKREAWSGVDGSGGGEAWGFAEDPGRPGEPGPNGPAGPPGPEGAVG